MTIDDLKPPGLRELYSVFTANQVPCPEHRRQLFQTLADGFGHGWHEVGWYLYWLISEAYGPEVLIEYNRLASERLVRTFKGLNRDHYAGHYAEVLGCERSRDRIDTLPVLRYVLYLRGEPGKAQKYLDDNLLCILGAYLGKPFLRTVIDSAAEEILWTHAASLYACSIRR
jgi:hypothetical protein